MAIKRSRIVKERKNKDIFKGDLKKKRKVKLLRRQKIINLKQFYTLAKKERLVEEYKYLCEALKAKRSYEDQTNRSHYQSQEPIFFDTEMIDQGSLMDSETECDLLDKRKFKNSPTRSFADTCCSDQESPSSQFVNHFYEPMHMQNEGFSVDLEEEEIIPQIPFSFINYRDPDMGMYTWKSQLV